MSQESRPAPGAIKTRLRQQIRERRGQLSEAVRMAFDQAIRQHLLSLIKTRDCHSIAAYWPFDGEPDLTPLFEPLLAAGCRMALPVVSGEDDHSMQFHAWRPGTVLTANRYGIPEPRGAERVALAELDMLLMPLVGYDRFGNRLGMGKGYYDRHLEALRDAATPLRVGVAYHLQETAPLEHNPWDIPLHGVVNERGWFTFTQGVVSVNRPEQNRRDL